MKFSISNKALWSSAVAVSIATLSFAVPATAQTDTTTTPGDDTEVVEQEDDGFDWGLLGLLGLAGLAGLTRKRDDQSTYPDPRTNPTTATRSDYTNPR